MTGVRVNITGLGALCAAGRGMKAIMADMYAGFRDPGPPSRFQTSLERPYPVFEIREDLVAPGDLPVFGSGAGRSLTMVSIALAEALNQARLDLKELHYWRVGVAMGATVGCTLNDEKFYHELRSGHVPSRDPLERYLKNNPAMAISKGLGLSGPAVTLVNACSSGSDAVALASGWIRHGICDIALAGGMDELSRITYLGFISLLNTSPEPCAPFDKDRAGLNLGEGAAVLVLERSGLRPAVPSLAALVGHGTRSDAHHATTPHPDGRGLRAAIDRALNMGDVKSEEVAFVNAHGTATRENDRIEGSVLADMFSPSIPVAATKAFTGHTLGAAGALEAAFTVQALMDGKIPPTPGFRQPDPESGVTPATSCLSFYGRYGLSNSLAFGGVNTSLLFEGE